MGFARNAAAVVALGLFAAGCASTPPLSGKVSVPPNAGVYKIGSPYEVQGTWYYPREQPDYDETGIASWYGPGFYGKPTADGEIYTANDLTAAHRTLPMPVNVRVTNLENGRSLIVRVNDRGPFAKGRIIDLSQRAATLLGFLQAGTARVRVTYVGRADLNGAPPPQTPPQIARAVPAAPSTKVDSQALAIIPGTALAPPTPTVSMPTPQAEPPPPPAANTQPTGQVSEVPVPAVTHLYVQVGAFSNLSNARRLLANLGGDLHISIFRRGGQTLYRVRTGPLNTTAQADTMLAQISARGANDAQIVVDQ